MSFPTDEGIVVKSTNEDKRKTLNTSEIHTNSRDVVAPIRDRRD